jgi:hypothetical protein
VNWATHPVVIEVMAAATISPQRVVLIFLITHVAGTGSIDEY